MLQDDVPTALLAEQRVALEGIVLKPNMVVAGKKQRAPSRRRGSR
jgi:fructose-bisphosphate aldolase class 1